MPIEICIQDIKKYPGFTHMEDIRIDQLYYKGKGLKK